MVGYKEVVFSAGTTSTEISWDSLKLQGILVPTGVTPTTTITVQTTNDSTNWRTWADSTGTAISFTVPASPQNFLLSVTDVMRGQPFGTKLRLFASGSISGTFLVAHD